MFTKKCKAIAALAICGVALVGLGSGKNPVGRPLKVQSVNTWVIDLTSVEIINGVPIAPATLHAEGVGTHVGRITVDGTGYWDLSVPTYISASGDGSVANGDQLTWELPGATYFLEFTSGTGRLENVSGGFSPVAILDISSELSEDSSTLTLKITAKGEGTITY